MSTKGQIAIPKSIRDALNLSEGSKLGLEVRGQQIILSKDAAWRRLRGAAADKDLMRRFAASKKAERDRENSRR